MRYDQGPARAAPATFPYPDHGTLAEVWGIKPAPATVPLVVQAKAPVFAPPPPPPPPIIVAPRPIPQPRPVEERLDNMSAERAFERFMRGER